MSTAVAAGRRRVAPPTCAACAGALPGPVALVPTMGALHEGHATLVRAARRAGRPASSSRSSSTRIQFGPGEDFDRYPRTWDADLAALAEEGADLVFAPGGRRRSTRTARPA